MSQKVAPPVAWRLAIRARYWRRRRAFHMIRRRRSARAALPPRSRARSYFVHGPRVITADRTRDGVPAWQFYPQIRHRYSDRTSDWRHPRPSLSAVGSLTLVVSGRLASGRPIQGEETCSSSGENATGILTATGSSARVLDQIPHICSSVERDYVVRAFSEFMGRPCGARRG